MMTRKLVIQDGLVEKELLLVGTVSLGRDPVCKIHSFDPLLSRRHAEFTWSKRQVTIRDLDSRNGILVNGVKVREQILKSGDVVQAGALQVTYFEVSAVTIEEERTRTRERTDTAVDTPTMASTELRRAAQADTATAPAPPGATPDATFITELPAQLLKTAPPAASGASRIQDDADRDETIAVRAPRPAEATFASDPDLTVFLPVRPAAAEPAPDVDATLAVSGARSSFADLDATMISVVEAQIVINRQLVVTSASPGCLELFGVRPEALVGGSAAEVLVQSMTAVASADGPPDLSIALSRSADRTLTLTFKAGQAAETAR